MPVIAHPIPVRELMKAYNYHIICALTFVIMVPFQIFAKITLTGKIIGANNEPIDMANVIIRAYDSPKRIIGSTFTDESGSYSLTIHANADSLIITSSSMEIEPKSIIVPNRDGEYIISTTNRSLALKEVTVKPRKIYSIGDTINYNVSSYLSQTDNSIGDVLRKMPGITVAENGQISYQGKPIKNFYIEGLDLMKGHYGIATNNIDPNNIATVQVLESHQDIKALKGLRPEEQASINLKLKEGVKGVFNLIATVGGGYGGNKLWDNAAVATYFKRNSQFLATYKGNNTGDDLSNELYSFDNDYSRTSNISSITMPAAPGINKKFYYLNRSHSATYNNVYRVGTNGELGINAAYLNDHDNRKSSTSTTNTLPDNSLNIVDEFMNGTARTQKAYGDVTYMNNDKSNYLKEQLKFDWDKNNADSHITSGNENISQTGKMNNYRLLNKFHLINRNSLNRGFEIYSLLNFEKRPHCLSVSPNLFPGIFSSDNLVQYVDRHNFSTENRFGLLSAFKFGNFTFQPTVAINYSHNSLKSNVEDCRNNIYLDYLDSGIGAEVIYNIRNLHLSFYIPLKYKRFRVHNRISGGNTNKKHFLVEPCINFSYNINSNHALKFTSSLNYMTPSVENLYSNYILTSYRQLSCFDVSGLYEGVNLYHNIGYTFKNILSMSFAGVDLGWARQSPEVLFGAYYNGLTQHTISRHTSQSGDMLSAKIHGSQGFDWKRMKIGTAVTYSHYTDPLLIQNEVVRYHGNSLGINADMSLSFSKWLSASYQWNYYQSASRQKDRTQYSWLRTVNNKVSIDLITPTGISLTSSLYHYYNNFNYGDKSFFLLNAEARYTLKRLSFSLLCDNLLNRKSYLYSSQSALTESRSIYHIRSRSILLKIRFRIF